MVFVCVRASLFCRMHIVRVEIEKQTCIFACVSGGKIPLDRPEIIGADKQLLTTTTAKIKNSEIRTVYTNN